MAGLGGAGGAGGAAALGAAGCGEPAILRAADLTSSREITDNMIEVIAKMIMRRMRNDNSPMNGRLIISS
ncbi:MAG: hypothetical protein QXO04_01335 [Nitrososphaerota archaeon]